MRVEGFNFPAHQEGPLRFVPGNDPNNTVSLGRNTIETDANGQFTADFELPNRTSPDAQFIRATLRQNVGSPYFTQNAKDTWDKIVETIFMALLATTAGTFLAIPVSFIAARNLMKPVRSPLASIALNLIGWVVGIFIGYRIAALLRDVSQPLSDSFWIALLGIVLIPVLVLFTFRWVFPVEEIEKPSLSMRIARPLGGLFLALLALLFLNMLASLLIQIGTLSMPVLGVFAFLGNFVYQGGDIVLTLIPLLAGLAAGGALSSAMGRVGQRATETLPEATVRIINILVGALAGATLFVLFGMLVESLYQIGRPEFTFWAPAVVGALGGLYLALRNPAKSTLQIGMVIYYVTRTILNGLRSVEALVMAIVFVITVGIGPFAGVMALGLHTVVSLAKLYSEQVENIASGPLEAIQATGANRLQTIVYGVVPQIIPPYISYTMYRWDINVRMSTIIGFVGGGGIGFLLIQNTNLLNYRAAATQMLAIAVVVASLDFVSSVIRERLT